jgi:hypothetical protein
MQFQVDQRNVLRPHFDQRYVPKAIRKTGPQAEEGDGLVEHESSPEDQRLVGRKDQRRPGRQAIHGGLQVRPVT